MVINDYSQALQQRPAPKMQPGTLLRIGDVVRIGTSWRWQCI